MGTENISINGDVSSKYDGIVTHNNDKSSINVTGSVNGGSHAGIKATAMNENQKLRLERTSRADVSLTITYAVDGSLFTVTIPAGANVDLFRNASGGIEFVTLGNLFSAKPV